VIEPPPPSSWRTRCVTYLDQQEFVMRAARCERSGGSIENPADFLEPEQVTVKYEGAMEFLHIEHDVTEIVCFHFGTIVTRTT
jgi:hypothetical protein